MELGGLHHMTAVTTNAAENVAFYTDVLGLRLVKKTVNQDDVSAYHLFYGDEVGNPGTEITFFDWPHLRVAPNHPGAGEVSTTELRVPDHAALDWWAARFQDLGVDNDGIVEGENRTYLDFTDPEGQRLRLSADEGEGVQGGVPWAESPVPREMGIRGLAAVDLTVRESDPTAWVLTEVLGFRKLGEISQSGGRTVTFEVGGDGAGDRTSRRAVDPPGTWRRASHRFQDARRRRARGVEGEDPALRTRRNAADRPLLLPFDLLPRTWRGALRDRHRRPRLRHGRGRRPPRREAFPPPVPGGAQGRDRGGVRSHNHRRRDSTTLKS